MRILSGIKPSGKLHVGNELGAVRNWLALQADSGNACFFMLADWHALTQQYDPAEKRGQIRELAVELLAAGVDPERVTFFRQSDIPEHLELAWYFACVSPVGELERMTQYKDKVSHGQTPNVGLFTYPILQGADILLYADVHGKQPIAVPVGHDQVQHVELTNNISRRFNNRFGETFPETKPLLTATPRVMSLKDPGRKMEKSGGGEYSLFMDDPPEEIERKVKAAVTDLGATPSLSPGTATLFQLLEAFGAPAEITQFRDAHIAGTLQYSKLKPAVAAAVIAGHAEFRERKQELLANPDRVDAILASGAERAHAIARETMSLVRERVGIR